MMQFIACWDHWNIPDRPECALSRSLECVSLIRKIRPSDLVLITNTDLLALAKPKLPMIYHQGG
jgi:hypothetical protein